MAKPWKQISKRYVFELSPHVKVRRDLVLRPDGCKVKYAVLEYPETAVIVPVGKDGKIFMVRLWRYPLNKEELELPMGSADAGESLESAARRELREETGLAAREIKELGMFYPSPGKSGSAARVYLARGLSGKPCVTDKNEITGVEAHNLKEIKEYIKEGVIRDAFTIAAMCYYEQTTGG